MAKDTSTMKFGKQAPTFKVNPSVSAPHPQPTAIGSFSVIHASGTLDIARIKTNDSDIAKIKTNDSDIAKAKPNDSNPHALELGPHAWAYYQRLMAVSPHQNPYAHLRYAPYPMPAVRPTHGQAPSSAPFHSYSSSMPAANPTVPQYPRPSTVPAMAARAPQGQAAPSAPFYTYPSSKAPANPTAPQYPRPSSVSTKKTARAPHCQATPTNPYPPSTAPASLNPLPSRIPIMNPYPDSAATTPESLSDLQYSTPSPPACPAPTPTPITSAPVSSAPVNDKEADAPPPKVEKKKFLTPRGCRWLRGVPADVYVATEMASDKFVPATLDEEEEQVFDDFLNPDMIED